MTEYRRELDISNGVARVSFVQNGVRYLREYFASYPDGVLVVRLSADQPGKITFGLGDSIPETAASRRWRMATGCAPGAR